MSTALVALALVALTGALGFAILRAWYWRRVAEIEREYAEHLRASLREIKQAAQQEIARRTERG